MSQESPPPPLTEHERLAIEAIGNIIEAWGFKRNQGRVWALLYLRGVNLSAKELREALDLSKGAVSMILRELERWGVVNRVRTPAQRVWSYEAETDLMRMVGRVIREREGAILAQVRRDLEAAYTQAKAAGDLPKEQLRRLNQLRLLVKAVERAVRAFLDSARLDVRGAFELLLPMMPKKRER